MVSASEAHSLKQIGVSPPDGTLGGLHHLADEPSERLGIFAVASNRSALALRDQHLEGWAQATGEGEVARWGTATRLARSMASRVLTGIGWPK